MTEHPTPAEDLIRIVGSDRARHTPEEVAAAEQELRDRSREDQHKVVKGVRRAGTIAAAIGLMCIGWPLFGIATMVAQEPAGELWSHGLVIVLGCSLQVLAGFLLFAAGLALRRRKDWGRKVILMLVWAYIVYCIAFTVVWEVMIPLHWGLTGGTVAFMLVGPAIAAVWVLICWKLKTYFSSPAVREVCREHP